MNPERRRILVRMLRYGVVGVASNGLLYAGYIVLTALGAAPEFASVGLFISGVAGTYVVNRGWSFSSARAHSWTAPRYVATYVSGMFVQVFALGMGHRVFGTPHQLAQAIAMLAAAATIFSLLNFWVFRNHPQA